MLVIRKEQMEALGRQALAGFEERLAGFVAEDFPEQAAVLPRATILAAVREGVAKAKSYGLKTEQELSRYVYLMFTFGRAFDADPAFPWAGRLLRATAGDRGAFEQLLDVAADSEHLGRGLGADA